MVRCFGRDGYTGASYGAGHLNNRCLSGRMSCLLVLLEGKPILFCFIVVRVEEGWFESRSLMMRVVALIIGPFVVESTILLLCINEVTGFLLSTN